MSDGMLAMTRVGVEVVWQVVGLDLGLVAGTSDTTGQCSNSGSGSGRRRGTA